MYDWVTETWNPVGGACPHNCSYCFAKSFKRPSLKKKYSGEPRLYESELKRNLGKDKIWFVGSCFDIWAEDLYRSEGKKESTADFTNLGERNII